MDRRWAWIKSGVVLAFVWLIVAAGTAWLNAVETTPATVVAFVEETPWDALAGEASASAVGELAEKVNALPPEDRLNAEVFAAVRGWFESQSPEARQRYLEQTLPRGLEQMIAAVNAMEPEQRRALIEEASSRLEALEGVALPELDPEEFDALLQQGVGTFLREASPETKLDLLPLIQRMQDQLRETRS
ncbi:MAG: hypothetical protein AAFX76_09865 [Planctomycetota bacterium]